MAWCPKCKNEYREGITICSDCGAQLVDSLDVSGERIMLLAGEEARMQEYCDFLVYAKISSAALEYDSENDLTELWIDEADQRNAEKNLHIFMREEEKRNVNRDDKETSSEAEETFEEFEEETVETEDADKWAKKSENTHPYVKAEEKASNYKSSAYALTLVGCIGLIAMILIAFGVIQISIISGVRSISFIVLTLMFVIFVGIGIFSYKESKKYQKEAKEENEVTAQLKEWFKTSYPTDVIDHDTEAFINENDTEEIMYFKRTTTMRRLIREQYEELDQAFLERLTDELYQEIYEV